MRNIAKSTIRPIRNTFFMLALMAVCLPTVVSAPSPGSLAPNKGLFLLSNNDLTGEIFGRTVIFLTHHDDKGSIGLIVNRETKIRVAELLPESHLPELRQYVYFGGPVFGNQVFTLLRTERPHTLKRRVIGNIFLATGTNALRHIIAQVNSRETYRVFLGYAGWAPGQLEYEIARGDWIVTDIDPDLVFDPHPEQLWRRLMKSWAGHWT